MGPNGEAAVVGFNDSVDSCRTLRPMATSLRTRSRTLARGRRDRSSTMRWQWAWRCSVDVRKQRRTSRAERVLMILSEATDVGSDAKLGEVLRSAQLANVTMYSVGLSPRAPSYKPSPKTRVRSLAAGHVSASTTAGNAANAYQRSEPLRQYDILAALSGLCSTFTIRLRTTPWSWQQRLRAARTFPRSRTARSKRP